LIFWKGKRGAPEPLGWFRPLAWRRAGAEVRFDGLAGLAQLAGEAGRYVGSISSLHGARPRRRKCPSQFLKGAFVCRKFALNRARAALESAGVIFVEENGDGPGVRLEEGREMSITAVALA
jgi:hypothetical protein